MARGGKRAGAGRKPNSPTIRTREAAERAFERGDRLPLDVMLDMMNGRMAFDKDQLAIAVAAAPYLHPRLQAVEQSGPDGGAIEMRNQVEVRFVSAKAEGDDDDDDGSDHPEQA